jgi:hypothetical protein
LSSSAENFAPARRIVALLARFLRARRLLLSIRQREVHMYYGAGGIILLIVLILLLTGRL